MLNALLYLNAFYVYKPVISLIICYILFVMLCVIAFVNVFHAFCFFDRV